MPSKEEKQSAEEKISSVIQDDTLKQDISENEKNENIQTETSYIKSVSEKEESYKNSKPFKIEDETPRLTDEDGWLDILGSNDLKKRVITTGQGPKSRPQRGDWITIYATGKLENGTIVEEYNNSVVILGDCDIVQGLDLAVALMEKDEVAEIIVPSRLAYGEQGKLPDIPSNSVIYYEVKLLDVKTDDDIDLTITKRQEVGDQKRERGNFWYTRGEFSTAVHCYRRALEILDDDNQNFGEPNKELEELLNTRIKVYNNLAAAQLKMNAYDAAIKSVNNVLMIEPKNVKALFRKGKIFAARGKLDEAIDTLREALEIDPEIKIIHQELSRLTSIKKKEDTEAKEMYRRMFKYDSNSQPKAPATKHWFYKWGMVVGGILTMVCGIAIYKHINSTD